MSGLPLIVRADDAGSCPEANRAIAACADAGVLQCVSVMAICPDLPNAARLLAHRTNIEFGLHFALNSEWEQFRWRPVSAPDTVASLVGADGFLRPMPADLLEHGFVVEEALAEARAQLQAVRDAGFAPTYLDEHCGVSWISKELEDGLAELSQQEGLLYVKHCPTMPVSYDSTDYTTDVSPEEQDLTGATPCLWVTHPGLNEPGGAMARFHLRGEPDNGEVARERDAERRLLCDPELPAMLRALGYNLAPYRKIFNP
ncbi:MAG: ChbG/HpnK family deacetylase [Armatimonadetes bacterium]|nr:ChbG/HpnK family deacetylase [Armatimonadota bacterium]